MRFYFSGGTQRFNGFPGGPVSNPRYPQGPNGYGPVGGFNGVGQYPLNSGFGGQFPQQNGFGRPPIGGQFGPVGNRPIGNGLYGTQVGVGNYFPTNGQNTNVLVGPGGPTGIIGRPTSGYSGSPAVLVGPGGPTGVVGRPPGTGYGLLNTTPNGYGAYSQGPYGQFGQNGFAGPIGNGFNGVQQTIDIGINSGYGGQPNGYGRPGGFGGPQQGGLGYPRPGGFGGPVGFGGIPYNRAGNTLAFDEPEENDNKTNKAEGKKN